MWPLLRFAPCTLQRPLRAVARTSTLAITLAASSAAVASADGAAAADRAAPPTDADADEATRVLEAYFATTEPAVGGRGAVRLKKPLVDGAKGVGDYTRSLVDGIRSIRSTASATEQSEDVVVTPAHREWKSTTLQSLRELQAAFARARDWDQFHTPRNVLIALCGEVGELCECFQWVGDAGAGVGLPTWEEKKKVAVGEECADVLLYLVRLCDRIGIDLPSVTARKMKKNASKYPAHLVKGSSKKYNEYDQSSA